MYLKAHYIENFLDYQVDLFMEMPLKLSIHIETEHPSLKYL